MQFTFSIAAPLYAVVAVIDLYLGLATPFIYPSAFFRVSWVASLIALYVHLAKAPSFEASSASLGFAVLHCCANS